MSAHVLLNLLNKLGKRDKMQGLQSILSLFRSECSCFIEGRVTVLHYKWPTFTVKNCL